MTLYRNYMGRDVESLPALFRTFPVVFACHVDSYSQEFLWLLRMLKGRVIIMHLIWRVDTLSPVRLITSISSDAWVAT